MTYFTKFPNCLKHPKTLFDSRPTVAWPRPLSRDRSATFFKISPKSLETSKKRCLTVGRRSRDLNHCRVTVQRLFSKFSQIAWNVQKTLFDSRPTVAWPPTTVAWPFSDFFQNFRKSLETSRKRYLTVARRSHDHRILVAWPFSDFFQNFSKLLQTSKNVVWQSVDVRVTSVHCRVTPVTFFRVCFVRLLHTLAYVVFLVILLLLLLLLLLLSFRPKARPRISSYRNGPILEISTSYQS